MKKIILICWLSALVLPGFSYTWVAFSPDSIQATNICFGVGSWKGTICSPDGMYLWQDDIMEWSFYTYGGLPVVGAAYLDAERILVAMGEGTYSDGVYSFNLQTHEFEVLEWILNPNFLLFCLSNGKYYVGTQFGGMYESEDGLTWSTVPYFTGKSCTTMDFYNNHLVVTEVSNVYNIYISDDYGNTWQEATAGSPMISDLKFNFEGELYGVFPDYSNSSGLWRSDDFGETWDVEFWSDNMSAVGFDAMGTVFVGWAQPPAGNEGIAIYSPGSFPPNLSFLNEGLPNLNIHKILLNPSMSAVAIFCCTDAGVWMSYDYMVGEENQVHQPTQINLYPNPFYKTLRIDISNFKTGFTKLEIFSSGGELLFHQELHVQAGTPNSLTWNPESVGINLSEGVYLLKITQENTSIVQKVIYSR